jgi:hypothetical protein
LNCLGKRWSERLQAVKIPQSARSEQVSKFMIRSPDDKRPPAGKSGMDFKQKKIEANRT